VKLTFLATRFPVLSETFVYEPLQWLHDAGVDVSVVASQPGSSKVEIPEQATVHILASESGIPTVANSLSRSPLQSGATLWRYLSESNMRPLRRKMVWHAMLPAITGADALVAHFGPTGSRWLAPAALAEKPLLVYFHGYDVGRVLAGRASAYDDLFRSGAGFLTNSDFQRDRLIAAGAPPSRLAVLPLGVSPLCASAGPATYQGPPLVVTIGRLVPKKAIDDSIRAFGMGSRRAGAPWEYHVVGDGPLRGSLSQLVSDEGWKGIVRLRGFLARRETIELLQNASVFVLASRSADDGDTEGTPVSILEAASLGLPVVATRHAGIPETLPPEAAREGFLVEERDIEGLSTALARLMASSDLRREWGEACRRHVEQRHSASAFTAGLIDAVRNLAAVPSIV
jgi:colanic acid/amylovoran biosynthesis glycosyltransferase